MMQVRGSNNVKRCLRCGRPAADGIPVEHRKRAGQEWGIPAFNSRLLAAPNAAKKAWPARLIGSRRITKSDFFSAPPPAKKRIYLDEGIPMVGKKPPSGNWVPTATCVAKAAGWLRFTSLHR